jgi:hypothetical protein
VGAAEEGERDGVGGQRRACGEEREGAQNEQRAGGGGQGVGDQGGLGSEGQPTAPAADPGVPRTRFALRPIGSPISAPPSTVHRQAGPIRARLPIQSRGASAPRADYCRSSQVTPSWLPLAWV